MQRQIKFRAFVDNDLIGGRPAEMYEVSHMDWANIGITCCELFSLKDETFHILEAKWLKVVEFTGEHAKNGREIYEGDIVKVYSPDYSRDTDGSLLREENFISEGDVKFRDGGFYIDCDHYSPRFSTHFHSWEVIGNIYENKELINKEV